MNQLYTNFFCLVILCLLFSIKCKCQEADINFDLSLIYRNSATTCDSLPKHVRMLKDPNTSDRNGMTYLHHLSKSGMPCVSRAIIILIENGADVNKKDNKGFTPLDYSLCSYNYSTIEVLLNNGAILSSIDESKPIDRYISENNFKQIKKECAKFKFYTEWNSNYLGARVSYSYMGESFLGLGIGYGLSDENYIPYKHLSICSFTDIGLNKNGIYGQRFSIDYRYLILVARVGAGVHTNFENYVMSFQGELGISILGLVEVSYGRQLFINNYNVFDFNKNMLHINVNIPFHNFNFAHKYRHNHCPL